VRPRAGADLASVALRVGDALHRRGIRGVVTGGACAHLYTGGTYQSVDVDIVLSSVVSRAELDAAMAAAGFTRRRDRYVSPGVPFFVEFPAGPLAIGADHAVRPVVYRRGRSRMLVLSATDACRDRLAAFYHWGDRQSLSVAVEIAARHRLRTSAIRDWSMREGAGEGFAQYLAELDRRRKARPRARPRVARRRSTS
jgi:hypothetical protein